MTTNPTTPNLGAPLLVQAQAQKEVTVNEAITRIDTLLNNGVMDKDLATPPGSSSDGDMYIVASSATDDWSGEDGNIAYYSNSSWKFITAKEGITLWVSDEDELYSFDGSSWIKVNSVGANPNFLINGNFDIWQRGTSFTPTFGDYTADRYVYEYNLAGGSLADETVSQQAFSAGQTDVLGEPAYYCRIGGQASGGGAGRQVTFSQKIEGVRTLAGQTATLSFYAKSSAAREFAASLSQNFGSGGSSQITVGNTGTLSLTTSWQKFTHTFFISSISGKTIGTSSFLRLDFVLEDVGLVTGSSETVDLAQVKLEKGDTATDFVLSKKQEELALCQRYYYQINEGDNGRYDALGQVQTSSLGQVSLWFPTTMRVAPTFSGTVGGYDIFEGGTGRAMSAFGAANLSTNDARIRCDISSATQGNACHLRGGSGSGKLQFDAEL